ncbi:MAG: hypothetical protein OXC37_05900, partial [Bdellovibrionaceae bacterium]|nr:hypothetical protein [Pseudobdellovibrionaceae bacterium]
MKKKTYYTFLLSSNNSRFKEISISATKLYSILTSIAFLFLLQVFFLTDYFGLQVDKWKISQLQKENKELGDKFNRISLQLKDLEKTVHQANTFSRKLQLIINSNAENSLKMIGKIQSDSVITALSAYSKDKTSDRSLSSVEAQEENLEDLDSFSESSLELRLEYLKGKSKLIKQEAWTLYTDLLEKKEILDNTPSILPVNGWISSHFGYRNETIFANHEPYFHRGMDIASVEGSPVYASADGKVVWTGYDEHG